MLPLSYHIDYLEVEKVSRSAWLVGVDAIQRIFGFREALLLHACHPMLCFLTLLPILPYT